MQPGHQCTLSPPIMSSFNIQEVMPYWLSCTVVFIHGLWSLLLFNGLGVMKSGKHMHNHSKIVVLWDVLQMFIPRSALLPLQKSFWKEGTEAARGQVGPYIKTRGVWQQRTLKWPPWVPLREKISMNCVGHTHTDSGMDIYNTSWRVTVTKC